MKRLLAVCAILVCWGAAFCQEVLPAPKVPPQPAPSAGPITLDVVVTDKAGHPIPGLQQQDFTLLDDRHPVPIVGFKAHQDTNPQGDSTSILLVVDDVNADFNVVARARTEIDSFLHSNQGKLPAPVSIAYLTERGFDQVVLPSTDGNEVASALDQHQAGLRDINRSAGFYGGAERMQMSINALTQLIRYEARLPGRKLVVWISPGWWIFDSPNLILTAQQQRSFFNLAVDLTASMRQSRIVLYEVDPRGLANVGGFRTFLWQEYLKPVRKADQAQPGDVNLEVLAVHSGGKVLDMSNDIHGEIAKCAQDASAWYRLSFDPAKAEKPDTWHDLQLKVDKSGLVVRTRNGYYAQP